MTSLSFSLSLSLFPSLSLSLSTITIAVPFSGVDVFTLRRAVADGGDAEEALAVEMRVLRMMAELGARLCGRGRGLAWNSGLVERHRVLPLTTMLFQMAVDEAAASTTSSAIVDVGSDMRLTVAATTDALAGLVAQSIGALLVDALRLGARPAFESGEATRTVDLQPLADKDAFKGSTRLLVVQIAERLSASVGARVVEHGIYEGARSGLLKRKAQEMEGMQLVLAVDATNDPPQDSYALLTIHSGADVHEVADQVELTTRGGSPGPSWTKLGHETDTYATTVAMPAGKRVNDISLEEHVLQGLERAGWECAGRDVGVSRGGKDGSPKATVSLVLVKRNVTPPPLDGGRSSSLASVAVLAKSCYIFSLQERRGQGHVARKRRLLRQHQRCGAVRDVALDEPESNQRRQQALDVLHVEPRHEGGGVLPVERDVSRPHPRGEGSERHARLASERAVDAAKQVAHTQRLQLRQREVKAAAHEKRLAPRELAVERAHVALPQRADDAAELPQAVLREQRARRHAALAQPDGQQQPHQQPRVVLLPPVALAQRRLEALLRPRKVAVHQCQAADVIATRDTGQAPKTHVDQNRAAHRYDTTWAAGNAPSSSREGKAGESM